ncbi:hypothetical protein LGQ04_05825 [Cellulosimicrobium marinum]|nr:hypothetical protein [Cellulosimicrobium marinum]
MYGADVAALRELGGRVATAGGALAQARGEIDARLASCGWHGADGDAFRQDWASTLGPRLAAAALLLEEAATALRRDADQQEGASTDGGGPGGAPGAGDRGAPGGDRSTPDGDRPGDPGLTDGLGEYDEENPVGDLPLDDAAVDPDQIKQGQLGDCWLLAGLGAIAHDDPGFFREHMVRNEDGTWTVTMYDDGEPVEITVEPTIPENGVRDPDGDPNWASIYEKAAAEYFGGDYADLDGGFTSDAFEAITGAQADRSGELDLAEIQDRLADGPVAVGTEDDDAFWFWEDEVDDSRIVPNHAYVVDEVREVDGELKIHVVNPWGPDGGSLDGENKVGDLWLTEAEYQANFDSVYSVPSTKG